MFSFFLPKLDPNRPKTYVSIVKMKQVNVKRNDIKPNKI